MKAQVQILGKETDRLLHLLQQVFFSARKGLVEWKKNAAGSGRECSEGR